MDENLELDQDVVEDFEDLEDVEEVDTEEAETDDTYEDEEDPDAVTDEVIEYDEDGNVIEATSGDDETAAESEERETNDLEEKPSVNLSEDSDLKQKYNEREAIIKDVLKAMGIDDEDIDKGLLHLAADATGDTVEEYTKKRTEARKTEEAQRVYREVMMERMVANEMKDLHSLFPETKGITKFEDIPNCKRYAELRDKGLTVKEAYYAANPEGRREAVAASVKQQAINASKSHLKSNVPIASKDTSVKISRGEMDQMRELFPDKSDKELVALYKKTR